MMFVEADVSERWYRGFLVIAIAICVLMMDGNNVGDATGAS